MIIETKFDFMEECTLKELELPCHIEEISMAKFGVSYRVSYYSNGERRSIWVDEFEICKK